MKRNLKKRLLITVLTAAMIVQSLSMPVLAAQADSVNEELSIETFSETQTGEPGEDQSDAIPDEEPEKGQPEEETPDEPTDEGSEEDPDESSEENSDEEQPDGTPEKQPGDETGESEEETPDGQVEDRIENTDFLQPSDSEPESEYVDVSDGVYQAGAFSVFGESADAKYAPYSVMPNATAAEEAAEYIYQQLLARETEISLSQYGISTSNMMAIFSGVVNDHPDLYYVRTGYSVSSSGGIVTRISPMYIDGLDDAAFQAGVRDALSVVRDDMTNLEKAVVLHDYLVINCEYDYDRLNQGTIPKTSYSSYGVLVDGIAVCQGYALAYKLLLNKVGIECYMVTSDAINHAWNLIVLDGEYYQVDTTWDDPVRDRIGRASHTYMFRSDAAFDEFRTGDPEDGHRDWEVTSGSEVVDYKATDTRYDSAFWVDCSSPLVVTEDGCYYTFYDSGKSSAGIMKKESLDDITDTGDLVLNIGKWSGWNSSNSFWPGAYSGLFRMDGRLYYNDTTSIYSVSLSGTDKRTEFTADTTDGYIYGSALSRGKVLYCLSQTPNMTGKEPVLVADITVSGGGSESGGQGDGDQGDDNQDDDDQNNQGLNLANLTAEFTTPDDTKISSAAEGKPKLLIFYSNTCWNSQNTIKSISRNIEDFAGADVYAIETNKGTKEEVAAFQEEYGCDEIVFSYDTGTSNSDSMWQYAHAGGYNGTITWPVICYIDADNRLQYVTTGYNTADVVLSNLKKYCGYTYQSPETYTITYVLNGGINNSANPSTYTPQTDTIILLDATRDGYRFDGWYSDESYLTRVTQILKGSIGNITLYAKWSLTQDDLGDSAEVAFKSSTFTYNGTGHEPKVVVRVLDNTLVEGQDYTLSYQNNINAGEATVVITGINSYFGSTGRTFKIDPAQLTITAKDIELLIGEPIPATYDYEVNGLVSDDELLTKPSFSCVVEYEESEGTEKVAKVGRYDIIPHSADAGGNYEITYVNGILTVASEYVSCMVTFDVQGRGIAPADYVGIIVGSTIAGPDPEPTAEGYRFDGWYRDAACTKAWNFDTDIVQSDITLYAKWLKESKEGSFALQEISDVYYTGKACKPAVSVYDGDTLLKAGKDYQIKYYNNTNANKDNRLKGASFNADLPYVEITGKGNYAEVVKVNFNILKASIDDGSQDPASGVTLKVSDQLVTAKKVQKPFSSIKYVKSMKQGTDYTLGLTVVNARDKSGKSLPKDYTLENAAIPAGYEGEFLLTVQGVGNYGGSICKTIHVTDKAHLIKNAKITLGKNLKNKEYGGKAVVLTPSVENSAETFTVKCGNVFLEENKDYTVSYRNNDRVGKAELIITGMGEYVGSKTVTFNIKGKAFTAKKVKVEGISNQVYRGRAWTQNGVDLKYVEAAGGEKPLKYGTDYTISYSKNINKGTATMTFKGVDKAGFSGSFKKTFKITAQNISEAEQAECMKSIAVGYTKAGAKPVDEIVLTNSEGFTLSNGKDYTLKYTNNKSMATAADEKPPTITVKGKGNYTGELKVYFTITKGDLDWDIEGTNITVKTSPVGYQMNKAADYAYKPSIKLTDGKTALRAGTDYEIVYVQNTQADYDAFMQKLKDDANYMQKLEDGIVSYDGVPRAVITEKEGSSYKLSSPKTVPLPIYQTKLTKSNLTVELGEAVYTGNQVTPKVTVYYQGENRRVSLKAGTDYTISYGANVQSGKNKGSVTISGIAPYYGGGVTVKFEIVRKPISY